MYENLITKENIKLYQPDNSGYERKTRLYLGKSLKYFFDHACINIYQGHVAINLMDYFPLLKTGFCTKLTLDNIMNLYIKINELKDDKLNKIKSDSLFKQSFNGIIPAAIYAYYPRFYLMRIYMEDAVNRGLIEQGINTYQVMTMLYDDFDLDNIDCLYFRTLKDINYFELQFVNEYLRHELDEEEILSSVLKIIYGLKSKKSQIIWTDIIIYLHIMTIKSKSVSLDPIPENDAKLALQCFITKPWIKLLYCIIIKDVERLSLSLTYIDPRIGNNEAYHVSIEILNSNDVDSSQEDSDNYQESSDSDSDLLNSLEIVNILKYKISERNWIEQQAIKQVFENLIGPSDIPKTLVYPWLTKTF